MGGLLVRFDPGSYEFRARVRPVLFVSVPLALAVWIWTQTPLDRLGWILSLAVAAGIPYVLSEKAADRGRTREYELWAAWGGAPTTQLLRHRDGTLNPHTRSRIHRHLALLCPELRLPTAEEESIDPISADAVYASCIDRVRVYTRDHRSDFPLVFQRNVAYGFRRNLLAIRGWGILSALMGVVAATLRIVLVEIGLPVVIALGGTIFCLSFFLAVVRAGWVREAAMTYARRLLEAVEWLPATETTVR